MNEILKDENYFSIHAWMVNKLNLSGNELLVYAVIYSFTENGAGEYMGTQKYLMEFTGIESNKTLYRLINKLIKKGYIVEVSHNRADGNANIYKAVAKEEVFKMLEEKEDKNAEGGLSKLHTGSVKTTDGVRQNDRRGYVKMTDPYNNVYNNNYNKKDYKKDYKEERKKENKYIGEAKEKNSECVLGENNYGREKYVEIMDRYALSEKIKSVVFKFIAHCNLNGKMVTNDKLERIIKFLQGKKSDEEREKVLLKAIDKGYFDVLKEERIKKESQEEKSSVAHFNNQRTYTQEYFDSLITKISDIKI